MKLIIITLKLSENVSIEPSSYAKYYLTSCRRNNKWFEIIYIRVCTNTHSDMGAVTDKDKVGGSCRKLLCALQNLFFNAIGEEYLVNCNMFYLRRLWFGTFRSLEVKYSSPTKTACHSIEMYMHDFTYTKTIFASLSELHT